MEEVKMNLHWGHPQSQLQDSRDRERRRDAKRISRARKAETWEQAQQRRAANARAKALRREMETPEQRQARRASDARAKAQRRKSETPEQARARRDANARYQAMRRQTKALFQEQRCQLELLEEPVEIGVVDPTAVKIEMDTDHDYTAMTEADIVVKEEPLDAPNQPAIEPNFLQFLEENSLTPSELPKTDSDFLGWQCTACLAQSAEYNIFQTKCDGVQIATILEQCTSFKVEQVGTTPQFICLKCYEELYNCNNFRKKFLQSQDMLKKRAKSDIELIVEPEPSDIKCEALTSTSASNSDKDALTHRELCHTIERYINDQLLESLKKSDSSSNPQTKPKTILRPTPTQHPGPKKPAMKVLHPIDCFLHFMEPLLDKILLYTNEELLNTTGPASITSKEELLAFVGLLIYSGTFKENHLVPKQMFASPMSKLLNNWTMTCDRFELLFNSLRFDEKEMRDERIEADPFSSVRIIWSVFNAICNASYKPSTGVVVEEHTFPLLNTAISSTVKFVAVWDSSTQYLINSRPQILNAKQPTSLQNGLYERLAPTFDCSRDTSDVSQAVFYVILNLASINAHVVHCFNSLRIGFRPILRSAFMKTVAISLIKPWLKKRESQPAFDLNSLSHAVLSRILNVDDTHLHVH